MVFKKLTLFLFIFLSSFQVSKNLGASNRLLVDVADIENQLPQKQLKRSRNCFWCTTVIRSFVCFGLVGLDVLADQTIAMIPANYSLAASYAGKVEGIFSMSLTLVAGYYISPFITRLLFCSGTKMGNMVSRATKMARAQIITRAQAEQDELGQMARNIVLDATILTSVYTIKLEQKKENISLDTKTLKDFSLILYNFVSIFPELEALDSTFFVEYLRDYCELYELTPKESKEEVMSFIQSLREEKRIKEFERQHYLEFIRAI